MSSLVVYNEINPFNANVLRELCKMNVIAPGEVWEEDVREIKPRHLANVTQFHAFAGIGVWSYAARRIGWPDNKPLWSGSCPCQPFSIGGSGYGFADERHLWPHFYWLIKKLNPIAIVGEQVAGKDGRTWFDLVQSDLEGSNYTSAAINLCACGVGSPNIRQRLCWLAYPTSKGLQRSFSPFSEEEWEKRQITPCGHADRSGKPNATNGFWHDADWLKCRDGVFRGVEPSTCPLADGLTSVVGQLHGYGNAVNAEVAVEFLQSVVTLAQTGK